MLVYTRDKFFNLKINTNASLLDEKISHAILESGVKTLAFSAINYYKIKYNQYYQDRFTKMNKKLVAKKIQDNNPGMTSKTTIQYAEKYIVNKKKSNIYYLLYQ